MKMLEASTPQYDVRRKSILDFRRGIIIKTNKQIINIGNRDGSRNNEPTSDFFTCKKWRASAGLSSNQ
jgi:hypothetical protein